MSATIQTAIDTLGLTVRAEFVPFSVSRNSAEKHRSLNWKATLVRNGRDVLTADYSAGIAHCPAYKAPATAFGKENSYERRTAIQFETEKGRIAPRNSYSAGGKAIEIDAIGFIYSLSMDSGVLDHSDFESWSIDYGYDADSRSAEAIYRACLEIALKLRGAIGEAGLEALREAFQDY